MCAGDAWGEPGLGGAGLFKGVCSRASPGSFAGAQSWSSWNGIPRWLRGADDRWGAGVRSRDQSYTDGACFPSPAIQPWRRITARLWHTPDSLSQPAGPFCQQVHAFVLSRDEYQGTDWTDMFPAARCETPATRIGTLGLGMRPLAPIGTHRKPGVVCGVGWSKWDLGLTGGEGKGC